MKKVSTCPEIDKNYGHKWIRNLRHVLLSSYGFCVDQVFALTFHGSFGPAVKPLTDVELVELHHVGRRASPKRRRQSTRVCRNQLLLYSTQSVLLISKLLFKTAPAVVYRDYPGHVFV